jgi:hypothetical protein
VPLNYTTSGNATTQVGMAKARPVELIDPKGLLFAQGDSGMSYNHSSDFSNHRNVLWAGDIDTLLDMTSRQSEIMLVDPRGV